MLKPCTVIVLAALVVATSIADAREFRRRNNPPGPAGGRGTNWWLGNPPGPVGGRGAGPRWRNNRVIPRSWVYWGAHDGWHWYKHPNGYWCMFDNDGNPPGPAGGPGTNWENPPGPIGGPGASPNSPYRPC